jgi:hypothetical protein
MCKLILILVAIALMIIGGILLTGLLASMTPSVWPITQGSLKVSKVKISGQDYVMIDGDGINQLGQIQSIDVGFDDVSKKIFVNRYIVRWNPFTKITVNNQWPVFYPLGSFKPGQYSVVYKTTDGEAIAGILDIGGDRQRDSNSPRQP